MTAQKERHQTWGTPLSPVEQVRAELGLTSGRPRRGSAFKLRGGAATDVDAGRLLDAMAARMRADADADRHKRWGDSREVDPVPAGPSTDLAVVDDAEIARVGWINEARAARLLPWQAGAATAVAGGLAWGAGEAAAMAAGSGGQVFVAGCSACVIAAAGVASRKKRSRRPLFRPGGRLHAWRARHTAAWAGASAWVAAAGVTGFSWELLAALGVGGAAVSAGWLREHQVTLPDPEPLDVDEQPWDEFAARWERHVACPSGQVPASYFEDGAVTAEGVELTLVLPSGFTVTRLLRCLDEVASALGCDPRQLVVERVAPDARGWVNARRAKVQYLSSSPIIGTVEVEHTGPRSSTPGRIGIGPYIDGADDAEVVLADGESVWSIFLCGATGSGKTELATALVADGRKLLPIVTVYFDGKRSSSPDLASAATVKALGVETAEVFTRCVEALVAGLQERAARTGESSFQWGEGRPIYWVILDEADLLWSLPGMAARWAVMAKTLRSLGGGILAMSQGGDLKVFGNSDLLRGSVCRNVVVMNIPTGSTGSLVAPGLPPASSIPMGGGYAHLSAEGSRPRELLRGRRLRSSRACIKEGLDPDVVWGARRALREAPDAPMCEVGLAAFAPLLGGAAPPEGPAAPEPRDAPSEAAKASARAAWGQGPAATAPQTPPVAPERPEPAPSGVLAPERAMPAGLTTNQQAALTALRGLGAGPVGTKAVADAAGLSPSSTNKALKALVVKGCATDTGSAQRAAWTAT